MKAKTLVGLVLILIVLAVMVGFVVDNKKGDGEEKNLGEPLFQSLAVNNIALITIVGPDHIWWNSREAKDSGRWFKNMAIQQILTK